MRSQRSSNRLHEQILASSCDVCFMSLTRPVPRQLNEGLEVLFCSKCLCRVHRSCYDLEASGTIINGQLTQFLCDNCREKSGWCLVCLGTDGALKRVASEGAPAFVHVFCGLVHKDIEVRSYYPSIEFGVGGMVPSEAQCEICGRANAQDKCAEETCKRMVHAFCAIKTHTLLQKEDDEPKCWKYCLSPGNNGKFDLSDEPIPYQLLREEVGVIVGDLAEIGLELPPVDHFVRQNHAHYMEEKGKKTDEKLRRGGFSYVVCETHLVTMYCFCANKEEGEMVLCECCTEWYHQKCVKYVGEKDPEVYICPLCEKYYEQKKRMVEEVRGGKGEGGELRAKIPAKVSLNELVWFMRVLDGRVDHENASKLLKEYSKYPLKSSRISQLVRVLSRNKLSALSEDTILEYLKSPVLSEALRPPSVLRLSADNSIITDTEATTHCERIRKFLLRAEGFLSQHRVSSPFTALKTRLDFKAKALSDSYERIIELSKVDEDYQELPLLRMKSSNYGYLDILRQLQSEQVVSYEALVQAAEQARQAPLPTQTQLLLNKATALAHPARLLCNLLQHSPASTAQIAALLTNFTTQHIKPPLEYTSYRKQKSFVTQLYIHHAKCNKSQTSFETTFDAQIKQLLTQPIKPTSQLVEIVNTHTPPLPHLPWPNFPQLLTKVTRLSTLFQVQGILQRKPIRQERLIALMQRVKDMNLRADSQQISILQFKWQSIQIAHSTFLLQNLTQCDTLQLLTQYLTTTQTLGKCIEDLGLVIEDDTWSTQVKVRKEQLQQLMILYTEAQLVKNPLTIPKLLHSITRNNSLVRNYYHLKKEQGTLTQKYTTMVRKVQDKLKTLRDDPKMQRKEQIRQNNQRPTLIQTQQLLQMMKNSKVQLSKQIKQLTKMLNNSVEIASKVRAFLQKINDSQYKNQDLLGQRKEIDELRKRILNNSELCLKAEMSGLYHAQILNRMRSSLQSTGLDLDKASVMLKYAEEEKLTHSEAYIALKDKYDMRHQRTKEQATLKQLQLLLQTQAAKDTSPTHSALYLLRKGLPLAQVHAQLSKNTYIAELEQKHLVLKSKVIDVLSSKYEYNSAKTVYLDALKSPFALPQLTPLSLEISKGYELLRRWKDLQRNYTPYDPIFLDFDRSIFRFQEIENVRQQLKHNQERLDSLSEYVDSFNPLQKEVVEDALEQIQASSLLKETELCFKAQTRYLEYWCKLLKVYEECRQQTIPYEKLKRLTTDAYSLLQRALKRNDDHSALRDIIGLLEQYLAHVKEELKNPFEVASQGYLVDSFIDVEDLIYEMQNGLEIDEEIIIYNPYQDLSRFRTKNIHRVESKTKELDLGKRRSEVRLEEEKEEEKEEEVKGVSTAERRKIIQILLKNVQRNIQLKKVSSFQDEIKEVEKQIYTASGGDIVKYLQSSESFERVFIKLIKCPHFSNRLIKKKFQFSFLQLMTSNYANIQKLQATMEKKAREQQRMSLIPDPLPETPRQPQPQITTVDKELHLIAQEKKKRRRRSPSRESEAKFSEDEHQLPTYIEKEYNNKQQANKEEKTVFPLMYDPEEQMQVEGFPPGSVLRLKECELEMSLKRKGRVEVKTMMYTEEDWRKVEGETFDPGFQKLSLRKDKSDSEIISYINKSKKKYKYLTGWFESEESNEVLKELAMEANEKHKVYGWQNEHIKLHVMSIHQLVMIPKLTPPSRVSCSTVAQVLSDDRLVFILQYPQRTYQIRDLYHTFTHITAAEEPCSVNVPIPPPEQAMPIMAPLVPLLPFKPIYQPLKSEEYQTWGADPAPFVQQPNPYNAIRMNLGFSHFSPIMTDEEDSPVEKVDLASNLLNKINALGKMPPAPPREQPYPMYGGYPYQGRNYPQPMYPQQHVFNPLANKFPMAPLPRNPMNYGPPPPRHNYYDASGRYNNYQQ